jgi:protein-disulfide isomerase
MSYCPYGNQAEQVMYPVYQLLKGKAEIEPHYVIYANYQGGGPNYCFDNESKYCSMHGVQEVHQDVRELCIYKYQKDKYWDFLMKVNDACSAQNVDSCWEAVANSSGIDTGKVKSCYNSEAISLLQNEVDLNKKYGVQGSPTLVINGVEYSGDRTPDAFKQGICSAFNNPPKECNTTLTSSGGATPTGGCG